jgi:hypothetical protein
MEFFVYLLHDNTFDVSGILAHVLEKYNLLEKRLVLVVLQLCYIIGNIRVKHEPCKGYNFESRKIGKA